MITIPILIYQYRKRDMPHSTIHFQSFFYLLSHERVLPCYFTITTIYEVNTIYRNDAVSSISIYLEYSPRIISQFNSTKYIPSTERTVFTQVLYNIVMIIPFRIFSDTYSKDLKQTFFYSLLLSLSLN